VAVEQLGAEGEHLARALGIAGELGVAVERALEVLLADGLFRVYGAS